MDFGCSRRPKSWATSERLYGGDGLSLRAIQTDAVPKFERRFKTKLSEQTLRLVETLGMTPVVPPKANWRVERNYDCELYKLRNEVERLFRRL